MRNYLTLHGREAKLQSSHAPVITRIRATDVTVGLRRIPVGFHVSVRVNGAEWQTTNKSISINASMIEWHDKIILPLERSANVHFRVSASFEFAPVLGSGTSLRELDVSVGELLDRSEVALPFAFSPEEGELVTSCPSLLVIVERGHVEGDEAARALRVLDIDSVTRRLKNLTDNGQNALTRYRKDQNPQDLMASIAQFTRAVDLCPPGHTYFSIVLFNFAVAQLFHCQTNRPNLNVDIDVLVTLFQDVLELRPMGHPDRPATLFHFAVALLSRFNKYGDPTDSNRARNLLSQILQSCSIEGYYHRSALIALEMSAVNHVVGPVSIGNAGDAAQPHDPAEEGGVKDMALFHFGRFQELGQAADLNKAISLLDDVVQFTKDDDLSMFHWLTRLAMLYSIRFSRLDQLSDLTGSIAALEDALPLCPNGITRAGSQNNLGYLLRKRYERIGDIADIEKSISMLEDAVRLTPDDPDTDKPNMLGNLSASLRSCYERLENLVDTDKSISVAEAALRRIPDHHPNTVRVLSTLGASLGDRFNHLGNLTDINKSVSVLEKSIRIVPDSHPDKSTCLNYLGCSLLKRFEHLGNLADIHRSISVLEKCLELVPDNHPSKPGKLSNLGYTLSVRFEHLGDAADIQRSISLLEDVVHHSSENDPEKLGFQNNLGRSLLDRFELWGDIKDIDRAVSLLVDIVPKDRPGRGRVRLENLSSCFWRRFHRFHDVADIKKAISIMEDALAQIPKGHLHKATALNNLGGLFIDCFEQTRDIVDINKAISLQEQALQLVPSDHVMKRTVLMNLSTALSKRFQFFGDLADIHRSISSYEDALRLFPQGHPDEVGCLHNLGNSLLLRFERLREKTDIEKAISFLEEAVSRTPDEHLTKALRLKALGQVFFSRFMHLGDSSVLRSAQSHFSRAARSSTGNLFVRLEASQFWIETNHLLEDDTLDPYEMAIGLLPQLAWVGLPLQARHRALQLAAGITQDAVASAIALRHMQTAIEWFEQGRSVVWGQVLQLRTPLDELKERHPVLAERLSRVSTELELISAGDPLLHSRRTNNLQSSELRAQRHHALAQERDDLLLEVRASPGFERFLLPKTFTQLTAAAHSGPVVILNASKRRCDALIVTAGARDPMHVPLSDITFLEAEALQSMLSSLLENGGSFVSFPELDRAARIASKKLNANDAFMQTLSILWRKVVRPVLERLAYLIPDELRRIFWCPTGPFVFLPIHAAGLYDMSEPQEKTSDYVISSYAPTLNALMLPPEDEVATTNLRILAVSQPDSDGQVHLPGAHREIAHLRSAVDALSLSSPHASITLLQSTGTVQNVLNQMPGADWVHFACHGIQDRRAPLDSGLVLAMGRRLKLSDIIQLYARPSGAKRFAFLSACQTATGEQSLPEEAVHLAAGMLLAGYQSVIATMWSIGDSDAPDVAQSVYEQLFGLGPKGGDAKGGKERRNRGLPDAREAARALHVAVSRLRREGASFISWVPFIHVGL